MYLSLDKFSPSQGPQGKWDLLSIYFSSLIFCTVHLGMAKTYAFYSVYQHLHTWKEQRHTDFFFFYIQMHFYLTFSETVHVSFLLVSMVLPILKMDAQDVSLPTSILIPDNDVCGISLLLNLKRFFYFPWLERAWKWAENKYYHPIQT